LSADEKTSIQARIRKISHISSIASKPHESRA
jgi:hypothetical protein